MSTPITIAINYLGVDLEVTGYYTPATLGKTYGPPEGCYPDEPSEFEIDDIQTEDGTSLYELLQCMQVVVNTSPIKHRDAVTDLAERCCEQIDNLDKVDDYEPD